MLPWSRAALAKFSYQDWPAAPELVAHVACGSIID
jgi:hypothetical protein